VRLKLGAVVLGSLAVALAASACTQTTQPTTGPTNQAGGSFVKADDLKGPAPAIPGATPGGTVTILGSTDFDDADPQGNYRGDGILVYEQLFLRTLTGYYEEVSPDGSILLKLAGDLATTTGTSEDGCKKWTYTLRDGIKFQDGSAITSKDIAYGVSRSFDGRLATGPQYLQKALAGNDDYESVYPGPFVNKGTLAPGITTPDDKTIVFTFAKAFCDFPLAATLPTTIPVPVAKDPGPGEYEKNIVASGPYQIESWTRGEKMTLVRNPNWDPNSDPLRHNYPDKWVFDWSATDSVVAAKRFIADQGDDQFAIQWDNIPSEAIPDYLGSSSAQARKVEGDTVFNIYLNINTQRVTDVDTRRAINYAVNKDAILKLIGGEFAGKVSTTITAKTVPGFKAYDAYPAPATGDVEKAKQLLAGKTPTLRFCYRPGTPLREQTAAAYKEGLERAGFQVVMAPTDATSHYTLIGNKEYAINTPGCDIMTGGWGQDYPSNSTVMGVLMKGGGSIHAEGNNNWSYLDVPEVNAELDRLGAEADTAAAAAGYMALDEKVMKDYAPLVPIYYDHSLSLVGSKIGGAYLSTTWGSVSLQNVYIKS
jgi:peptide/nickel transport system substrate-binding protein